MEIHKKYGLEFRKIAPSDAMLLERWYSMTDYFGYATGFKKFSEINQVLWNPQKQNKLVLMIDTGEDRKTIGFIYGEYKCVETQPVLWIHILIIEPAFQHKGYGTYAVQKLLHSTRIQYGPMTCFAAVSYKNQQGLSFWKKVGFTHSFDLEECLIQKGSSPVAVLKRKIN
ncbi:MAG TPA: hypothetical protein DD738_04800 [Ruminiclostridium sp.]|nr:hypothetical protein [Ruminiclostridium sp.]